MRATSAAPTRTAVGLLTALAVVAGSGGVSAQPDPAAPAAAPTTTTPAGAASTQEVQALKKQIKKLELRLDQIAGQVEESELEKLTREAEAEAKAPAEEQKPEERTFLWGALALQKLNPEISIGADFVAQLIFNGDKFYAGHDDRSGMPVREVGLHFQHVLDPYSMFKAAFHFEPGPHGHAGVEEIYITWSGLIPSLAITVGRFRQNFGVLNRWHEHALDQVNFPMAMEAVLGPEGLNQSGVSIRWFMPPLIAHANELTLEITDGENETLFAGEHFTIPSFMLHLKNYYDLSESTYLEVGLTGMLGFNNRRGYEDDSVDPPVLADEPWRRTVVLGANLTLRWNPPKQAKYRSITWRSEYYYAAIQTALDAPNDLRQSWGVYSYVDYQLATRWFCGVRFDAALPTLRAPTGDTEIAWDVVPYITVWQSEFVYLRLEYRYGQNIPHVAADGSLARRTDNRVLLQVDFAAGPHKHDKY
jgi:hypothetical protein